MKVVAGFSLGRVIAHFLSSLLRGSLLLLTQRATIFVFVIYSTGTSENPVDVRRGTVPSVRGAVELGL